MMMATTEFNEILWHYYAKHGRHDLPWRQPNGSDRYDGYSIMVSELMLQQTQVKRVIPKFHEFLISFPTVDALAVADLADVLRVWSGLGYNRRAKFLWQAANKVVTDFNGKIPATLTDLVSLPGVGKNTAGAILAYTHNEPALFIETNVRTVIIHHFFNDQQAVSDNDIYKILEESLDRENPREYYWALMDYGTHIKQTIGNLNKYAKNYTKQSKFAGSRRQIRGQVLKALTDRPLALTELQNVINDERLIAVLNDLISEGLIRHSGKDYAL